MPKRLKLPDIPEDASPFQRQLALAIRKAIENSGYDAVSKDIQDLSKEEGAPLTRKQLSKLARDGDLPLRSSQLYALDRYLKVRQDTGVARLFSPPSLLNSLVSSGNVSFVIGSQPEKGARRIDISRWDIRAMRVILNRLYSSGRPLQIGIEDVIFREEAATDFTGRVAKNEVWYHEMMAENGPSLMCLGSPKANHCAEPLLARMMGVEPFQPWPTDRPRPFAFVWPHVDPRAMTIRSCCQMDSVDDAEALVEMSGGSRELLDDLSDLTVDTSAIVFDDCLVPVRRRGSNWDTYAVVAARRFRHRVHVCVAGLTGPATLGAAELLPALAADLEDDGSGDSSFMSWMVVKVHVEDQPPRKQGKPVASTGRKQGSEEATPRGDERRVISRDIVGDMRFYRPTEGN